MMNTKTPLRIAFMGTPDFAVSALLALHETGHHIVAAYSQPPKPVGRGHQIQKTSVHLAAEKLGVPVYTPRTLRNAEEQEVFRNLRLDVAVVAAYGLILPKPILDAPKYGCINIHASLLPRWRGAAPIQRAILAGDNKTGVTIMQMAEGLDTGHMLMVGECPITSTTTTPVLHNELSRMGSYLIVETLEQLAAGKLIATPQPHDGVTYAAKLAREDGRIDWQKSSVEIDRLIRGLLPWPGCFFMLGEEVIKVHAAELVTAAGEAGTLISDDFTVACGQGALRLVTVQRAGKPPTDAAAFLRGARLNVGQKL